MAKTKKVIALVLAFMMIFSSVSVIANAFNPVTDGGSTLTVTAQILKNNGTEWVACDKVTAGEPVKVRVSVGTDYYSNLSNLIFFYDNTFFSDSYGTGILPLTVNDSNFSDSAFTKSASGIINDLVDAGCVSNDYLSTHNYFAVSLEGPWTNYQYDASAWLFEFDLTVLANASGDGAFEVLDSTVQKTTNPDGYISVPKGPQGGDASNIYEMCDWFSGTVDCSVTVTTDSSITLNPAGGEWADGTSVAKTFNGATGAAFTRPALSYTGKTLAGWYDSSIANATLADCTYGPEGPTAYSADEDIELTAFWIDQVGATFSYNFDGAPAPVNHAEATPGYPVGWTLDADNEKDEYIVPDAPQRTGYEFRGWSTDAAASPQATDLLQNFDGMVYGNEGVTYYMIWAKAVTVTFTDTHNNTSVTFGNAPDLIYAGDPFTETVPTPPTYTGYTNVAGEGNYVPAAPSVVPDSDTTYNAIYEANSYIVNYIIYSAKGSNSVVYTFSRDTAYGETILTNIRYTAPTGKQLNAWYTDQACDTAFNGGTLDSTSGLTLYGYLEAETFTVTFDLAGGNIGGDTSAVTSEVPLAGTITAPADPVKDGYVFAGWTPLITGTDVLDTPAPRTYTATWELDPNLKEYFYLDDGTAYETIDNVEGANFEVPADPYKYGHSFAGWAASQGSDVAATLPSVMPDASTYYYAIFTPNTYDVTFDADGGYFDGNQSVTQKAVPSVFNDAIVLPAEPVREGYTFQGWAETAGQTSGEKTSLGNLTVETSEDEPLVYYAAWTIDSHTLTINYVDGNGDPIATAYTDEIEYGTDYSVDSPAVTGHTPNEATVTGTMGTENVTVTVTYSPNSYNLTIHYVYADNTPAADDHTETVVYNTAYSVDSPAITGYTPNEATVTGTMGAGDAEVTVTYNINSYNLTIHYAYADTTQAAVDHTETVVYNTAYSVDSPAITGYTPDQATVAGTMGAGDVEVTVTYNINSYNLTIHYVYADNTQAAADHTESVVYNTAYSVDSPAITGYTPDVDPVAGTMPAEDVTVTVKYSPNAHTVTWVLDGGNIEGNAGPIVENKVFGDAIVAPGTPVKTGYIFSAWTPAPAATVADQNYEFTATYTANSYDATFYLEGGKVGNDAGPIVVPTNYDSAIVAPADPDKDGYTFQGWSLTQNGAVVTPGIMDDINGKTFYAVWTADNASYFIDVYYMGTDGTYTTFQTYAGEDGKVTGDPVSVDPAAYAQTGFTFDSANSTLNGVIPPTGELHLVVKYSRDQHDIAFISEGNTVDTISGVYYGATAAALTSADVQKTGYTLAGWSSTAGGSVGVAPGADITMGTSDLTYYAVWTPDQVTITVLERYINVNTGNAATGRTRTEFTATADGKVYICESVPAEPEAGATYILFSQLDQGLPYDAATPNYVIDTSATIEGTAAADGSTELEVWYTPAPRTLTYDPNGGSFAPGTPNVDGNGNLVEDRHFGESNFNLTSVEPSRTGYTFLGWDRSATATTATWNSENNTYINRLNSDTTLYAVWSLNSHTLTVNYAISDSHTELLPAEPHTESVNYGDTYSFTPDTITGYEANPATVTGTMGDADEEVTVTYSPKEYTLTVNYVISGGNGTAPATHTEQVYFNTAYSVESPTVTGYTPNIAVVEGTMNEEGKTITVTYNQIVAGLTINYIFENGSTAAPTYSHEYNSGDNYSVTAPAITGYTPNVDPVAGTMGDEPVVVTVTYIANNYPLNIIYVMADGNDAVKPANVENQMVAYGTAYSVASPGVEGYTPDIAVVSGTMDENGRTETVTYTKDAVEIKFVIPERITADTNYGKLDYPDASTVTGTEYAIGSAITAPSATETAIAYYTFLGWTTTPITGLSTGNADATLATIGNAEGEATYYAVYEREAVYLEKLNASATTVIDRNGKDIGYWAANYTAATFPADGSALWFVTGITPGRLNANTYTSQYVKAHGDGTVTVTRGSNGFGTGTLITVTDKVTNTVVEEFYVVIYGDIDGNGTITAADLSSVSAEIANKSTEKWSKRGTYKYYKIKAADLANPSMSRISITAADSSWISGIIAGKSIVNQQTGVPQYKQTTG